MLFVMLNNFLLHIIIVYVNSGVSRPKGIFDDFILAKWCHCYPESISQAAVLRSPRLGYRLCYLV